MQRREFITTIGLAVAWPFAVRTEERERRIGVLINLTADDAESKRRLATLVEGLRALGWVEGHNLRIEARWGASLPDRVREQAAQMVALAPDVILASGDSTLGPLLQATRTLPIVFVIVPDPVGAALSKACRTLGGMPRDSQTLNSE